MPLQLIYHQYVNSVYFSGNIFVTLHLFVWILLRLFFHAICFEQKNHKYRVERAFPVDGGNETFMDAKCEGKFLSGLTLGNR